MHRECYLEKPVQTSNMEAMTGKKCLNECGLLLDRKAICVFRAFVREEFAVNTKHTGQVGSLYPL
jgi:hypothetical protein